MEKTMAESNQKLCIGIDVSKDTLDIYWQKRSYKIANNKESIFNFIETEVKDGLKILCVMESTGGYERVASETFHNAGIAVHIAHPNKVHAFARACGHFAKTDKLDAILLHKYAQFVFSEEEGDIVLDDQHKEIIALRHLSKSIENSLHAAQCRIKQMPKLCSRYLETEITLYKAQISQIQEEIDNKIDNHPELKAKRDILLTMKGVGKKSASILLSELPELGTISRKEIASLTGVAPRTHQSGKKTANGHISGGRFYARKILFMVALVASRFNCELKIKYQQMLERGKAKKVALVAIMRDIIVTLNAMIKNKRPYICRGNEKEISEVSAHTNSAGERANLALNFF